MANPLPNEDELYRKIKDEHITIHPIIWELLSHHISNDLYLISLIIQSTILNSVKPRPITRDEAQRIFERVMLIKDFMSTLNKMAGKQAGY